MEDHLNFLITFENTIKYDHIYPRFALSSSPHIFPNMSPPNFLSFRFYNSLSSVSAVDVFVGSGWSTGGQENLSVGTWFLHMIWWCVEKNSKSSAKRSWKTIRWLSKFMVLDQNLSCFREIHRLSPTYPLSSLSQMLPGSQGVTGRRYSVQLPWYGHTPLQSFLFLSWLSKSWLLPPFWDRMFPDIKHQTEEGCEHNYLLT